MNYKEKYLKYKSKYLLNKNNNFKIVLKGGTKPRIIITNDLSKDTVIDKQF